MPLLTLLGNLAACLASVRGHLGHCTLPAFQVAWVEVLVRRLAKVCGRLALSPVALDRFPHDGSRVDPDVWRKMQMSQQPLWSERLKRANH
mmetsp:Transcript_15782/g.34826  ORF Transcript_15782/g.34826 Transcript_15782/m.34826 type:complete len:91 (+) Transcript_15782:468-740(+)